MTQQPGEDPSVNKIVEASSQIVGEVRDQANELIHLPLHLLRFFMHPYRFIQATPDLKTVTWVSLAIGSGVLGAIINALVHQSFLRLVLALLILPLGSFLSVFATSWIIKLAFREFHKVRIRFRSAASIFAFSNSIWWICVGLGDQVPAIALIGFAFSLTIAGVGFIGKLNLPKNRVTQWFVALAIVHTILWSLGRWIGS